ncbi:MAG: hypothetical protein ACYT04_50340, partial [Nostoc sp.]
MSVAEWEWGVGSGEEAFSGCTDFFQKSNTSPIVRTYQCCISAVILQLDAGSTKFYINPVVAL